MQSLFVEKIKLFPASFWLAKISLQRMNTLTIPISFEIEFPNDKMERTTVHLRSLPFGIHFLCVPPVNKEHDQPQVQEIAILHLRMREITICHPTTVTILSLMLKQKKGFYKASLAGLFAFRIVIPATA
jgi:hypothetical protein